MQDTARDARSFALGKTRQDLDQEPLLADALIQCLVLMGRAAAGVSHGCRTRYLHVPWQTFSIRADDLQQNYMAVDLNMVWRVVTQEVPDLLTALERIIPAAEQVSVTPQKVVGARQNIEIAIEQITAFCRRYQISTISLFGSVLREDFHAESDIDVLVAFEPGYAAGLFALADMQSELAAIFQRPVDLCTPDQLSPYIRQRVVDGAEVLYPGLSEAIVAV